MINKIIKYLFIVITIAFIISLSGCVGEKTTKIPSETASLEKLNISNVTTTWNLSFLFSSKEEAVTEFNKTKLGIEQINRTYRQEFEKLNGKVLLEYLEDDKNMQKSIEELWIYAYSRNTLNVNDEFFEKLVADMQDLSTQYSTTTSFAQVRLISLSKTEWDALFNEEPGLEKYRAYLESNYIRFTEHRPQNESHAAFLADISNQRMKLETDAMKLITNNVTVAGNTTLENGEEYAVNSQSYYSLLSTDTNRNNRKKVYDQRYYHLINESDRMAQLYYEKVKLDELYARELNFTDSYESRLFNLYLTKKQIDDMNSVFKERKYVFGGYNEFRKNKLGIAQLRPYDLSLQLMDEPDKKYNYTDSLLEIQNSYSGMYPEFNDIFIKTVTGNYIDVYPDPENGKQPGGYAFSMCALKSPSIIFLNYNRLINDKKTITHELGHGINFYLMGNNVDYLYCSINEYEGEIPSTFNEELFVDYVIRNYDKDTAVAVLSDHIGQYQNYFGFQPLISEFEYKAHKLIERKDDISGAELNSLWTNLDKEYRIDSIKYYEGNSAGWTYINHIYFTNNYYTFNYAVSKAITLSMFKKYKEDPAEFNRNYVEYLSAGTTVTPPEKLKKYFGIEINRKLFEDAMDVVELRINELNNLDRQVNDNATDQQVNKDVLFQTSTIGALLEGVYDDNITFGELKKHGDFGLGTFKGLDGEMLELDGKVYQIKTDGVAYSVNDSMYTPFALVTFFEPDEKIFLNRTMNNKQFPDYLEGKFPTKNIMYAIKIKGNFDYVKTRSVPGQNKPYPKLVEVTKNQSTFEFHKANGTMIGFWLPVYMKGINVAGYHFHFITDDRTAGGHVLEYILGNSSIEIDYTPDFLMELPKTEDFYKVNLEEDKQAELEKAEN